MTPLALFLVLPGAAFQMAAAGAAALAIALWAARNDIARARGIEKVVALTYLCVAVPLAVFGAEHFAIHAAMLAMVPSYMPWRLLWVYLVGVGLIAASLSMATRRLVKWSGALFGAMMFLFVAMLHVPGAIHAGGRIPWTIVFRELSFGSAGWVLAGSAMSRDGDGRGRRLVTVGRTAIAITAILFGVEHFLHPLGLPGVPLEKEMPAWVPVPKIIDYVTGAFLLVAAASFLAGWKARTVAAYLGGWIVLLVVAIYGPVLVGALANTSAGVQIEGVNYFADTLLFGGVILAVAAASKAGTASR